MPRSTKMVNYKFNSYLSPSHQHPVISHKHTTNQSQGSVYLEVEFG